MQKGTREVVWQGMTWNSAEDIICIAQQWWWHTAGHNPQQPLAGAQTLQKDWWGLSLGQLSLLLFTCQKKTWSISSVTILCGAGGDNQEHETQRVFSSACWWPTDVVRPTTSWVAGVGNKDYLFYSETLFKNWWILRTGSPLKSGSKLFLLTGCAN